MDRCTHETTMGLRSAFCVDCDMDGMRMIDELEDEITQLRQALEELFTAYQTLDEETRPADVLPLELIQDIMPQIEQALKGTGE